LRDNHGLADGAAGLDERVCCPQLFSVERAERARERAADGSGIHQICDLVEQLMLQHNVSSVLR